MKVIHKSLMVAALAAMSMGTAFAQSGSAGGGGNTASSSTFQDWLNDHSTKNNGRVSRQAYMDEAGRRWDMMDKQKQGLTMAEIRGMYNPPAVMGGPTATNAPDKKGIKQ